MPGAARLKFLGESADRQANLGEALMAQANGVITAEAQAAFTRAVTLDGTTVSARYYLGVAAEQDGNAKTPQRSGAISSRMPLPARVG